MYIIVEFNMTNGRYRLYREKSTGDIPIYDLVEDARDTVVTLNKTKWINTVYQIGKLDIPFVAT